MQSFNLLCVLRKDLCFHCKGRQLLPGLPENKFMSSGAVSYVEPNLTNLSPKSFQSANFSQHFQCLGVSASLRNLPNPLQFSVGIAMLLQREWVHMHAFGNLQCKLPFFSDCKSVFYQWKYLHSDFQSLYFLKYCGLMVSPPTELPSSKACIRKNHVCLKLELNISVHS